MGDFAGVVLLGLFAAAGITGLWGWLWTCVLAYRDGFGWLLGCVFVPFFAVWFAFFRATNRKPSYLILANAVCLVGAFIIGIVAE